MALGDIAAVTERCRAHTQDEEHAATTGLSAQKGQILHVWDPNPTGEALHPTSEPNSTRQPTALGKGQRGTQSTGRGWISPCCATNPSRRSSWAQDRRLWRRCSHSTWPVPAGRCPHPSPSLLPQQGHTHFPMSVGRLCRDTSFKAKWPRLRSWVKPSGSLWEHEQNSISPGYRAQNPPKHLNPAKAKLIPAGINLWKGEEQEPSPTLAADPAQVLLPRPQKPLAPVLEHKSQTKPCHGIVWKKGGLPSTPSAPQVTCSIPQDQAPSQQSQGVTEKGKTLKRKFLCSHRQLVEPPDLPPPARLNPEPEKALTSYSRSAGDSCGTGIVTTREACPSAAELNVPQTCTAPALSTKGPHWHLQGLQQCLKTGLSKAGEPR